MKGILRYSLSITALTLLTQSLFCQDDATGLLGDNFSLESALEQFKKSKDLESYEEALNKEDNHVHNLDLNQDGEIDYISVNDYQEGDVHAIVISSWVSKDESQDIAVIELEKTGDTEATLQIVGDEDFYGNDMILEPQDVEIKDYGKGPNSEEEYVRIVVNVWFWPSVRWIYGPTYVTYRSPWRWAYYPGWWRPWRPLSWTVWRPYRVRYTPIYRVTSVRRVKTAHVVYKPHRSVSKTVSVRHKTSITKAKNASVKRSTTTVARTNSKTGKTAVARKTNSTIKKDGKTVKKSSANVRAKTDSKSIKAGKKKTVKKGAKGKKKTVKKGKKVKKRG